jgi:ApaG protein
MTAAIAGNVGGWPKRFVVAPARNWRKPISQGAPKLNAIFEPRWQHRGFSFAKLAYIASMYRSITRNIEITAKPHFLENQSQPDEGKFVWAYTITIANHGTETVKLLTRHWIITDGNGQKQEVQGPGVLGEQPVLRPNDSFQYSSGCPLNTPSGVMVGTYGMVTDRGEHFDAVIPAFSLDSHFDRHSVN